MTKRPCMIISKTFAAPLTWTMTWSPCSLFKCINVIVPFLLFHCTDSPTISMCANLCPNLPGGRRRHPQPFGGSTRGSSSRLIKKIFLIFHRDRWFWLFYHEFQCNEKSEVMFIAYQTKTPWYITETGDLDLSDWKLDSTTCRNLWVSKQSHLSCLSLQNLIWQFCQSQSGTWALETALWISRNSLLKPFESQRNHLVKEQGSNYSHLLV